MSSMPLSSANIFNDLGAAARQPLSVLSAYRVWRLQYYRVSQRTSVGSIQIPVGWNKTFCLLVVEIIGVDVR